MYKKIDNILKYINSLNKNTFMEVLNIEYIDIGNNFLLAKMPIIKSLYQPIGYLHGGAILSLAESVGSMLSYQLINNKKFISVCIEISANYINIIKNNILFAKANLIHKGTKIHFIQIKLFDKNDKIISQCKMTNMIIYKS